MLLQKMSQKKVADPAISCLCVDSIEKRPFYSFVPPRDFLSVGFTGCNLNCPWCLNSNISQQIPESTISLSASELISTALKKKVAGIVFTYSEPLLYPDYLEEVHYYSYNSDLKLAIKTNGCFDLSIVRKLGRLYDAFNVDIKGDDEVYKLIGGSLETVKQSVEELIGVGTIVEISYLLTPMTVDKTDFHNSIAEWLASLNRQIIVHLLKFYPNNGFGSIYPDEKIVKVKGVVTKHLKNVCIFH